MTMKKLQIKITGTRMMLMHSDILSNPLDPLSRAHKALTSKRKKTDEDHEAIAQSEFRASLYYTDEIGVYIPGANIEAAIREGAKMSKLGKHVQRAVEVVELEVPLDYPGKKKISTPTELWDAGFVDSRSVKVSQARLTRYRPAFREWSCEFGLLFNDELMDQAEVLKSLTDAGQYCGIGDHRPKYGRFTVEVL